MTRYELLDRIGVGSMAELFHARAIAAGGFEKPVAIKRILPHLASDRRLVEAIVAEAKLLSQLRHRNIVQVFDVGLGENGTYFVVLEYVDGMDLGLVQRDLESRARRLPLDLALHIGAEVCDALAHAYHTKAPDGRPLRLVHRNVSPRNILLSRAGEVKLTDFGVAKRAEEVTRHTSSRGQFAYMSPEQAQSKPVDARSDVFSLAVVIYELVLGVRLFSKLGDLGALMAVRDANVAPASTIDPSVPPELDALLTSALARDPAARPVSAAAFGAKLRAIRYALDEAANDPATELGRVVDSAPRPTLGDAVPRAAVFEPSEATVIRLAPPQAFASRASEAVSQARAVLDKFAEEETRVGGAPLAPVRATPGLDDLPGIDAFDDDGATALSEEPAFDPRDALPTSAYQPALPPVAAPVAPRWRPEPPPALPPPALPPPALPPSALPPPAPLPHQAGARPRVAGFAPRGALAGTWLWLAIAALALGFLGFAVARAVL